MALKLVRRVHLADMPLDVPDMFLRIERRYWDDGSSCLHMAKWSTQPNTGRPAPWWPPQYTQITWGLVARLVGILLAAMAMQGREEAKDDAT